MVSSASLRLRCALLALCAAARAAAQAPPAGAWEPVVSSSAPPALVLRKPASFAGCFFAVTNTSAGMGASQFDVVANAWVALPLLPAQPAIGDPFALAFGGLLYVVDELAPGQAVALDTANAAGGWTALVIPNAPAPMSRYGQRFAAWGSLVYAFSGAEIATGATHSDVMVVDLVSPGTSGWLLAAADGTPGLPPGRVGYSVTTFGLGLVIYGGVSIPPPNARGYLPDVCFDPTQSSLCDFHDSVWVFLPGNHAPSAGSVSAANFLHLGQGGPAIPAGRFDHTAAGHTDTLYVYGGTTAKGTTNELWSYSLISETWAQVAPSSPAPSIVSDIGYGAGVGM